MEHVISQNNTSCGPQCHLSLSTSNISISFGVFHKSLRSVNARFHVQDGAMSNTRYPDLPSQHAVVIKTNRIYLRPVTPDDLTALHSIRMNPRVMQYM